MPSPRPPPQALSFELQEIKSAGSSVLTTPGLAAFKSALRQAQRQHDEIAAELKVARSAEDEHASRYRDWKSGSLLRRLFKQRSAALEKLSMDATERRREPDEQLRLSSLPTDFDMSDAAAKALARLCDDFSNLARSHKIWDNVAARGTNRSQSARLQIALATERK